MSLSRKHLKLFALAFVGLGLVTISLTLRPSSTRAGGDTTLEDLASYRTWTKITKEPIKGAPAYDVSTIDVPAIGGG